MFPSQIFFCVRRKKCNKFWSIKFRTWV